MSTHKVEVSLVTEVNKHPNADRLDVVHVNGWFCVCSMGVYKVGDKIVYIPIDSVLDEKALQALFPPDSKIVPKKGRIRACRIRGVVSQGMVADLDLFGIDPSTPVGTDVADICGISKYEPPVKEIPIGMRGHERKKEDRNPNFDEYTDLQHLRYFPNRFAEGEEVVVTEKIHGTNFRAGWVPFVPKRWWEKVLAKLGFGKKWEFVYGSRRVQLQDKKSGHKTWYETNGVCTNVYEEAVEKYNLRDKIPHDVVIYGEIYGDGIQKGYTYGCPKGTRKLVMFESQTGGKWDKPLLAEGTAFALGIDFVPTLYRGPYDREKIEELANGPSVFCPSQKVMEGVVIRSWIEDGLSFNGRKICKLINLDYLVGDNTDFH